MFRNRRRRVQDGSQPQLLADYATVYNAIGAHLQEILPAGWSRTWILAEVRDTNSMIVGAFTTGESTVLHWPDLPAETDAVFRRLYTAAATGAVGGIWTSVSFQLDEGGHFEVNFGYEPRPVEDQAERVTAWIKAIEDALR